MVETIKTKSPPEFARQTTNIEDINAKAQNKPNAVMTVRQASEYLGLAVSTLNKWRCHGDGPEFVKMGRAVRYRIEDIESFIVSKKRAFTD